jgi:hypothetical protein
MNLPGLMVKVTINEPQSHADLKKENERLRQIVHEKVAEVTYYKEKSNADQSDALRWRFFKKRHFKHLGLPSPERLESNIDNQMKRTYLGRIVVSTNKK